MRVPNRQMDSSSARVMQNPQRDIKRISVRQKDISEVMRVWCGGTWWCSCRWRKEDAWGQPPRENHERHTPGEGGWLSGLRRHGAKQRLVVGPPQHNLGGMWPLQCPCMLSRNGKLWGWQVRYVHSQGQWQQAQRQGQGWQRRWWPGRKGWVYSRIRPGKGYMGMRGQKRPEQWFVGCPITNWKDRDKGLVVGDAMVLDWNRGRVRVSLKPCTRAVVLLPYSSSRRVIITTGWDQLLGCCSLRGWEWTREGGWE